MRYDLGDQYDIGNSPLYENFESNRNLVHSPCQIGMYDLPK